MSNVAASDDVVSGTRVQVVDGWELLINGEPRVRDVDVAQHVGMAEPRKVRRVIVRHRVELEAHGSLTERARRARSGNLVGSGPQEREVNEYWLNEPQAMALAAHLRTPRALELRIALVKVFVAVRRGQFGAPPAPEAQASPPAPLTTPAGRPRRGTLTETTAWSVKVQERAIRRLALACRQVQAAQFACVNAERGLAYGALARLLSDSIDLLEEGPEARVAGPTFEQAAREVSSAIRYVREQREKGPRPEVTAAMTRATAMVDRAVELAK